MRSPFLIVALSALCGFSGGCSLLFSESVNPAADGGASDDGGGGGDGGGDGDSDAGPQTLFGQIELTIGDEGDFPTYSDWKLHRSGDLIHRQEMYVTGDGDQFATGILSAGAGECEGTVRRQSSTREGTELLTLDLDASSPACVAGQVLTSSDAGAGALTIVEVGPVGAHETVTFLKSAGRIGAPILIDGFTTSSEFHLEVRADPLAPHEGIPGQGVVIESGIMPDGSHGIDVRVDYTEITGFEITRWAENAVNGSSFEGVHIEADFVTIDRMLIHSDGSARANSDSDGIGSKLDGVHLTVRNSIIYDVSRAGIQLQSSTVGAAELNVENCTLAFCVQRDEGAMQDYGCVSMAGVENGILNVHNTVALSNGNPTTPAEVGEPAFIISGDSIGSVFGAQSSNNASNDATAPGSASVALGGSLSDFQSLAPNNINLHLADDATKLVEAGKVMQEFNLDIDGDERMGLWSIGADHP